MDLLSWSLVATVLSGFAAVFSIVVAILSVYWTRKFAKAQQQSANAQVELSRQAKNADANTKQTDEYETAIALYEKATKRSIFEEIDRFLHNPTARRFGPFSMRKRV